ncbi:glycosyltransferase involved in cell wall biosynthesis [Pararhizobium capsulatum DSM 1112]|uniref:Glycosyltransferase involved in cell wall biosynthesis n=2 Tax=Pararhizobium capsulatum TaxID=34014 RepID=A0ABU0BU48_9HYPH|nr:glycosyltransferase involved in cell wall biosynthesis [Pararhizobium capsulatum DSM 1112]
MGRQLMAALDRAGHEVSVASKLRTFSKEPRDLDGDTDVAFEIERLKASWEQHGKPDAWFTYHPYYKAPDLLGPRLSAEAGIAYVTAEASYSPRRDKGGWASSQARLIEGLQQAAVNICMTERDRIGLAAVAPTARFVRLAPFIDASSFLAEVPKPEPNRLVCVAMMRPGDKLDSFRLLAAALSRLDHLPWRLSVVGDGVAAAEVKAAFAGFAADRVEWLGERQPAEIATILPRAALYVWPGCGEAYGLAYLEAQAAGLPVVAQETAGVPEVVEDGRTGWLAPAGDIEAYAAAIAGLLEDGEKRQAMAAAARNFAGEERSIVRASQTLAQIFQIYVEPLR